MTTTADAARALAIGGTTTEPVLQTLLWTAGILLVFVPLSVRKYRRIE